MSNLASLISLSEDEVRRSLDLSLLVPALESAFRDRFSSVTLTPRVHIQLPHGIFLVMTCADPIGRALGTKFVLVRNNPSIAEERVQATYVLLDVESAQPRLCLSANYLTDVRTAATSALATKFLARENSATLGIFGTGRVARAHLEIFLREYDFQRVLVCGRDPGRTAAFVREASRQRTIPIQSAAARACASESDVLCACTTSADPLFDGSDLRPGTHINLTGAFQPHTREADTHTIRRSRLVVDTYDAALSDAGDILIPIKEGAVSPGHIAADLHELVSKKEKGRQSPEEITVFKSVGCALEDLVAAELLLSARA
jgi:ornithine cyclodeaminase/alanine dehydrogenase-like protein (mu-crystallin family)